MADAGPEGVEILGVNITHMQAHSANETNRAPCSCFRRSGGPLIEVNWASLIWQGFDVFTTITTDGGFDSSLD